jgi:ferredoxin-type protein NapF
MRAIRSLTAVKVLRCPKVSNHSHTDARVKAPSHDMSMARRAFLRGRIRSTEPAIRPPWAMPAEVFEQRCDGCGDCVGACPTGIVKIAVNGLAQVDFSRGECRFCGQCVSICLPQALLLREAESAWTVKAAVGTRCLSAAGIECRVCGECCEVGAIRFRPRLGGPAQPELESGRCTGCGACFGPCPVSAIAMEVH